MRTSGIGFTLAFVLFAASVANAVVKSPNAGFVDSFGWSISFSATGRTLAVGAPSENSSATGIDGNQENENAVDSGAAYLY